MCNALAYAGKIQRRIVSTWIGAAFAQDDATAARKQWRSVADQVRPRVSKLAGLLNEGEADVLVYMEFSAQHRAKLHSTDVMDKIFLAKFADLQFLLRLSRRGLGSCWERARRCRPCAGTCFRRRARSFATASRSG